VPQDLPLRRICEFGEVMRGARASESESGPGPQEPHRSPPQCSQCLPNHLHSLVVFDPTMSLVAFMHNIETGSHRWSPAIGLPASES